MSQDSSVIQIIQLILAPAVMINACGLLLLSINTKFSTVLNRIRLLNDENRKFLHIRGEREFNREEQIRFSSITRQLNGLVYRAKIIRNAVSSYIIAIALFVITSLIIGLNVIKVMLHVKEIILAVFLLGMICVLLAIIFMGIDAVKGYEIVKYEVDLNQ